MADIWISEREQVSYLYFSAAKEYGDEALTREERLAGLNADDYISSHDCIAVDGVTNSDAGATQQPGGKMADGARFIGIELQPACADMAARSVSLNGLDGLVRIDNGDIKEVSCNYKKASFDIVTSNPPYIKGSHGSGESGCSEEHSET